MRVRAINGSSRKSGRTVELLEGDLEAVRRAGLVVDFWNRKTGLSGYFRARQEGRVKEWLAENRSWKVGAGIAQAGHSGGTEPSCSNAGEWKRPWMARRFRKEKWPRHNMGFRIHWPYSARTSRLAEVKDM